MSENESPVLLCTCGDTLSLDYDLLDRELSQYEGVKSVAINGTACQDEGMEVIKSLVAASQGRLVIAACTSQKIKVRIDNYLRDEGIDSSQIQYVNIREHSAWVHDDIKEATEKSLAMIKGEVKLANLSEPVLNETKEVASHVTVIGGGIAGIESALSLSNLGYKVTLLERESELGGHVIHLPVVAPTGKSGTEVLSGRLESIKKDVGIDVHLDATVKFFDGEMGNFTVHYVDADGMEKNLQTSGIVMATGFSEFKPTELDEYRYGKNPDVLTQFELSCMLSEGELNRPSDGGPIKEIVMVQCVGSRAEDYKRDCSKLCCTFAIDNALEVLKRDSEVRVRVVYMDIRVPFENELIYKESREKGVDYIRGRVSMIWEEDAQTHLKVYDSLLNKYLELTPDLVVLSSAVLPSEGLKELSETLGFDIEEDGHVKELYGKLRRLETRRRGVVAVGGVTRPQFVFEAVTDAQAGALVIHNELQGGRITKLARGAVLNVEDCGMFIVCATVPSWRAFDD